MRLNELFQPDIEEVSMSPGALADFAKTDIAMSMKAGFEAELIVPDVEGEDSDPEPDYDEDTTTDSLDKIRRFFLGGDMGPSRREIDRAIQELEEDFFEFADEKMFEEWQDVKEKQIREKMKEDDLTDEEMEDVLSNENTRTYRSYEENALDEFRDDYDLGQHMDEFLEEKYPYMTDIHRKFDLDWPYWNTGSEGGASIEEVANEIEDAIGMEVKASGSYHGAKRGSDYFILEPDSSINSESGEAGLELVSPPMPLAQCLEFLDLVFDWAKNRGCYTDRSTGFHMGISIPDQTMENVDHLKFIMFLGDEYVLSQFNRQSNSYAKSMLKNMTEQLQRMQSGDSSQVETILQTFKQGMNNAAANAMKRLITTTHDRYVTVNIKKNYIEVRSAGGRYLEDLPKIKNTLLRYVKVMALAADPAAETQEYAKKVYKFLSPLLQGNDDVIKYFSQYSAGTLPATALKSFIKQAQTARLAKNIPDLITINDVKKGTYAVTVYYLLPGNVRKKLKVYASGRSDAISKAEAYLQSKNISPAIYHIETDLDDPTNQTPPAGSSNPTAGTYIIQYQSPYNTNPQTTAIDANSAREAEEWFRSSHGNAYQILNTSIAR